MREVYVAKDNEIAEGQRRVIAAGDAEVGVFRIDGELIAWRNHCPHQGGPVCQGRLLRRVEERLDGDKRSLGIHFADNALNIVCPWHGYEFDVRTGRHVGLALDPVRLAAVKSKVRDGAIYALLDA